MKEKIARKLMLKKMYWRFQLIAMFEYIVHLFVSETTECAFDDWELLPNIMDMYTYKGYKLVSLEPLLTLRRHKHIITFEYCPYPLEKVGDEE